MLVQSHWDTLLTPAVNHHFMLGMNSVPQLRTTLFNVQDSTLSAEVGVGVGGMGTDPWDAYKNTGNKGALDFNQQYSRTYTHQEYPVTLAIEKRLLINDQYGVINRMVQNAGQSAIVKMEKDAATLFNNAFTTADGADGVALCSASHPVSKHASGTTFSNTGTLALNKANVSATRVDMMQFKDDKNELIGIMPNELWVPPELEDAALEIAQSVLDPSSGNNAVNPQNGRFTVIPWLRLTDTNAWFMVDGLKRQQLVNWYEREPLQAMIVDETTTHIVYEFKLHYSFGYDDWRWVFGNNPS